jgi:hypothetical protein
VLLVARTDAAHRALAAQFAAGRWRKFIWRWCTESAGGFGTDHQADCAGSGAADADDGAAGIGARGADGIPGAERFEKFTFSKSGSGRGGRTRSGYIWRVSGIRWRGIGYTGLLRPSDYSCMPGGSGFSVRRRRNGERWRLLCRGSSAWLAGL